MEKTKQDNSKKRRIVADTTFEFSASDDESSGDEGIMLQKSYSVPIEDIVKSPTQRTLDRNQTLKDNPRISRNRNLAMKIPGGRYSVMNENGNYLASQLTKQNKESPFSLENPQIPTIQDNQRRQYEIHRFQIRLNGLNKILEVTESTIGEKLLSGSIKNVLTDDLVIQFFLKDQDLIYYDNAQQIIKIILEGNHLVFMIDEKKFFMHFLSKMSNLVKMKLNLAEFDSFNDKLQIARNKTLVKRKKENDQISSQTSDEFDVYTQQKINWRTKRFDKKMMFEPSGKIQLIGYSEEYQKEFYINWVHQILVNSSSTNSNIQVTFTFKVIFNQLKTQQDETPHIEVYFSRTQDCQKFLNLAQEKIKLEKEQRRELFIIKQSLNTKRKSRLNKQYSWFMDLSDDKEKFTAVQIDKNDEFKFLMIEEDKKREEDVEYISENEIQFKVILTEMNTDRQRQIMLKCNNLSGVILLTFSSVYKILQFIELLNLYSFQHLQMSMNQQMMQSNDLFEDSKLEDIIFKTKLQILETPRKLRVLSLTFNMARKAQKLSYDQLFQQPYSYDMIVIGGQETKMTHKTSLIIELANYLGQFSFMNITSVQMWEMFLVAFVKTDHLPHLKYKQSSYRAAGIGNILGNKGGLQISFKLYDYLFNFINVHLVHGEKRYEKRNEMMSDLIRKMRNQREELDPDIISDFSFIIGDLNYRLESTFEDLAPQIDKVIQLRKSLDQFEKARLQDRYTEYTEYDINFMPTYKRNRFDQGYFNKKNQSPSYTDRILIKNNTNQQVKLVKYDTLENVFGSDHRPIILDLELNLKPVRFLNLTKLRDKSMQTSQGLGIIKFNHLNLKNIKHLLIENFLKRKLVFPSHLQISFYADYLESFSSSSEFSLPNITALYTNITWSNQELPQLYTPINDLEIIKDKRLMILIWITNETCNQEVIGQINIRLDQLQQWSLNSLKTEIKDSPVIIANTQIGQMDCDFSFEVVQNLSQRRQSRSENSKKSRKKNYIKMQRDHSA
ncbi:endonuclease exonuclease phosphatase family protein [Stylonychia lemnae]|uniref:Endonuclease exonuclease phosphatase family protein n=1 Tax=Stylonychia lemnae TaxID=5949 RepID=A0A078BBK0_STYLE|nr:endonuclease exonuclease phosphatase family protein [Stylonychia lemnae]|eukprot:CDW91774.1 endonuclease exonuclease phosphatase family protein [Stylonychia lemnae]